MHKIDVTKFKLPKKLFTPISSELRINPKTGKEDLWVHKTYNRNMEDTIAHINDSDDVFIDVSRTKKKSSKPKRKYTKKCKCK